MKSMVSTTSLEHLNLKTVFYTFVPHPPGPLQEELIHIVLVSIYLNNAIVSKFYGFFVTYAFLL